MMKLDSLLVWLIFPFAALLFAFVVVASFVATAAENYLGLRLWSRAGQNAVDPYDP
jgi:hypothetical protein